MMAYVTLEDLSGEIEVLVFPRTLEKYRALLEDDALLLIKGRIDYQEENAKFFAEEIRPLIETGEKTAIAKPADAQQTQPQGGIKVYLRLQGEKTANAFMDQLLPILQHYPGNNSVYFYYPEKKKMLLADKRYWVEDAPDLYVALAQLLGSENISIKE